MAHILFSARYDFKSLISLHSEMRFFWMRFETENIFLEWKILVLQIIYLNFILLAQKLTVFYCIFQIFNLFSLVKRRLLFQKILF